MADPLTGTELESHYGFGRNWAEFADLVDPARIESAEASLLAFLPPQAIQGARFLDIGCGSGLFSLAALRLGAADLLAVDIDPLSVETTQRLLRRADAPGRWRTRCVSLFELDHGEPFDIVYAWGVLHHTGDLWRAVDRAGQFVAPGGHLFLALYRKTLLCPLWRLEKRCFTHGPEWFRQLARAVYRGAFVAGLLATGRKPATYFAGYRSRRGMDWDHDMDDWLGGHPYQSTSFAQVDEFLATRGFRVVKSDVRPGGLGLLGSGCDQSLFRRDA